MLLHNSFTITTVEHYPVSLSLLSTSARVTFFSLVFSREVRYDLADLAPRYLALDHDKLRGRLS
jgi:hypothetical protein